MDKQQSFLLLKKEKKPFQIFQYKMTQRNTSNVKLPNSQLNKLKSEIKNGTQGILDLSSKGTKYSLKQD